MHMWKKWCCFFIAIAILFIGIPVSASEHSTSQELTSGKNERKYADDRVIVVMSHKASLEFNTYRKADFPEIECKSVTDLTANMGAMVQEKLRQTETVAKTTEFEKTASNFKKNLDVDAYNQILCLELSTPGDESILKAIKVLEQRDDVLSAGPDHIYTCTSQQATTAISDPYYSQQWGLDFINMPQAWNIATSQNMVTVGVIDSGIQATHADLDSKVITVLSRSYITGSSMSGGHTDNSGHGTKVAGIIAAEGNSIGVCGVGKGSNVRLISLMVAQDRNCLASNVILAINYAALQEIPIINFSYSFVHSNQESNPYLDNQSGLRNAIAGYPGLFISTPGNAGQNVDSSSYFSYPAEFNLSNMIIVGACTSTGAKWASSNYGATYVDLFAPGVGIYTCTWDGGYGSDSGTSFAAPFVSGVAALIMAQYPTLTTAQVKARILNNTRTISALQGYCETGGVLDAYKALR